MHPGADCRDRKKQGCQVVTNCCGLLPFQNAAVEAELRKPAQASARRSHLTPAHRPPRGCFLCPGRHAGKVACVKLWLLALCAVLLLVLKQLRCISFLHHPPFPLMCDGCRTQHVKRGSCMRRTRHKCNTHEGRSAAESKHAVFIRKHRVCRLGVSPLNSCMG